ncbi:MAG TPA: insulinase family protein, partial [Mariprofundaceae bacterium]|nr:insulinase family protein [Mariprofundaceae bacterium]
MILRALFLLFLLAPLLSQAATLQRAGFANGTQLIVEEDHSAPEAIIEVWLKAGGRDEVPGKTGLAHVLEHMMFKGSRKLGPE